MKKLLSLFLIVLTLTVATGCQKNSSMPGMSAEEHAKMK